MTSKVSSWASLSLIWIIGNNLFKKKCCSSMSNITLGVPQGSVVGRVHFIWYINDMSRSLNHMCFVHFADDTTVFASDGNINNVRDTLNEGGWFSIFRLFQSILFLLIEFHCTFSYIALYHDINFIIIVFWLGSNNPSRLFFKIVLLLSILTPLSCLLLLFLCLISSLLFQCASVSEDTRAWVPVSYSHTEWHLLFCETK